mmetsp:Transcript_133416/g.231812  ORF Transcript_133416/g.231812 Transcript_133416/m.231812 type:complete len:694 (+) Transcript_133416:123-2204(+)
MSETPARVQPERRRSFASVEEYHQVVVLEHEIKLEGDLYTNALMSALEVPKLDDKESSGIWRTPKKVIPICSMLAVSCIQLTMSWAVYLHVNNNMVKSNTRPLFTAYEMFVGSNITIPLHTVEALCGEWEDHEMKDFAQGPLSMMKMPDGTVYGADDSYSLFYNVKQPTRTWNYAALGEERSVMDAAMFVISEGITLNPFTPSGYSLLFILTLALFYFTILIQLREMSRFANMLLHFLRKGLTQGDCFVKGDSGNYKIAAISYTGQVVGWTAVLCRLSVAVVLVLLGSLFLTYTTLKIELILNGLALIFLLELGQMLYLSSVPDMRQQWIEDLEPVGYRDPDGIISKYSDYVRLIPALMGPFVFTCAIMARWHQIRIFKNYFRLTAAICLFAGPTTPFARHDIVHPVAGFCDSLLGVKCAPHVTPIASAQEHGYCLVTDQSVVNSPTVQFYLDDPNIFANRYSENGTMNTWLDWGDANPQLYKSGLWMEGPYQDLLRKNCLQLYQKTVKPDDVLVDDDKGETMDGAPFQCKREALFNAVFGEIFDSLDKMPIEKMIEKVADLTDPAVVNAIDNCKNYDDKEYQEKAKEKEAKAEKKALAVESDLEVKLEGGLAPAVAMEAPAPSPAMPGGLTIPDAILNFKATSRHQQQSRLRRSKHLHGQSRVGAWWWPQAGMEHGEGGDSHGHILSRPYMR